MNRLVGLDEHYETLSNQPQTRFLYCLTYDKSKADEFRDKLKKMAEDNGVIYAKKYLNDLSQFVVNSEDGWEEDVVVPMNKYYDSLENPLPRELQTQEAIELLNRLVAAGYLDYKYQPIDMSGTARGLWAHHISQKLNIKDLWIVFGKLWGDKSETLRSYYAKAQGQRKTYYLLDEIKRVLN